jgi:ribosomal protein S12
MKRIIYKNLDNSVSIIIPSPEALQSMTIEQIAEKDVPTGLRYKIVDVSEIPTDRTFRNAWEYVE